MGGHGQEFGHELVSESEGDSDSSTRFFETSDTDSDKLIFSTSDSDADSDTRVRSTLSKDFNIYVQLTVLVEHFC